MKKITKIISVVCLGLFLATNFAGASEVSGGINPGISTGIDGTVIVQPTANLPAGTYASAQSVSLAATGSKSIHYTADGSDPTCSGSDPYSGPIAIISTTTLKAISCYLNGIASSVSTFDYVINLPAVPPPTCESFTYSDWNTCKADGTQTRTVLSSLPEDCEGGSPILSQSCTYVPPSGGGGGGGGGGSVIPTVKTGDINVDTKVDEYDFALMMSDWGESGSGISSDLNKDGTVDEYDFAILMLHWGE